MLILWLAGPSKPLTSLFATETPTPTLTFTPSITPLPTDTPTITLTPTLTSTSTPSSPFTYTVQEGDSLFSIAQNNNLGENGVLFLLILNPLIDPCDPILRVGDTITVPNPGAEMPTATPLPANLARGTKVTYLVQSGDNLAAIAAKFNSIVDEILKLNNLDDPNLIGVGQCLIIPANLVTPTATRPPTSTPRTPVPVTPSITPTP
jgi:LysM repeat protein